MDRYWQMEDLVVRAIDIGVPVCRYGFRMMHINVLNFTEYIRHYVSGVCFCGGTMVWHGARGENIG